MSDKEVFETLPKDALYEITSYLSVAELVTMYDVNKYYREFLENKYILAELSKINKLTVNSHDTFEDFIVNLLRSFKPSKLYTLHRSVKKLRFYINDLRILSKFLIAFFDEEFDPIDYIPKNFDAILDRIRTVSNNLEKEYFEKLDVIEAIPPLICYNGSFYYVSTYIIDMAEGDLYTQSVYLTEKYLTKPLIIYILERLGHNVIEYANISTKKLVIILKQHKTKPLQ